MSRTRHKARLARICEVVFGFKDMRNQGVFTPRCAIMEVPHYRGSGVTPPYVILWQSSLGMRAKKEIA